MKNSSLTEYSQLVSLIHEAGLDVQRWRDAITAAISLLQGDKGGIVDVLGTRLVGISAVGHDASVQKMYADYYYSIDPTMALVVNGLPYAVNTVFDNFPRHERSKSEYFDFAAAAGIGDAIGVGTDWLAGRRSILSVQRPVDAPGFGDREKEIMQLVAPHIDLAKRTQWKLGHLVQAFKELADSLDALTAALFIVNVQASICHLNASAARLMRDQREVRSRDGKLVATDPRRNAALQVAIRAAAVAGGQTSILALQLTPNDSAEVIVAPLNAAHPLNADWQEPMALVGISWQRQDVQGIARRMQSLYGLTVAEGMLVGFLAQGHTVEDIGRVRGVRDATVRTQLRSIFVKTGVNRQADLMKLVWSGALFDAYGRREPKDW